MLSVPKRLRYFMQRDGAALNSALRIFLRVVEQCLHRQCSGAAKLDKAAVHIGAVAFIHRFGSGLNTHVHFHVCAIDGVFSALEGDVTADPATPPGVVFHPANGIDEAAVAQVQAQVRTRILRAIAGRSLIERFEAREMMLAFKHSGFSVDAGVRIEARRRTAPAWSGCCATARVHRLPWNGCASGVRSWSTTVPNLDPDWGEAAQMPPDNALDQRSNW